MSFFLVIIPKGHVIKFSRSESCAAADKLVCLRTIQRPLDWQRERSRLCDGKKEKKETERRRQRERERERERQRMVVRERDFGENERLVAMWRRLCETTIQDVILLKSCDTICERIKLRMESIDSENILMGN